MNISPVSFAGTAKASSFQERISRPQTFTKPAENPSAASGLGKDGKGKKHTVRNVAAAVIVTAAAAAGLAYAARAGKLTPKGEEGIINKIKKPLEQAGNFIYEKAEIVYNNAKSVISKHASQNPSDVPVE